MWQLRVVFLFSFFLGTQRCDSKNTIRTRRHRLLVWLVYTNFISLFWHLNIIVIKTWMFKSSVWNEISIWWLNYIYFQYCCFQVIFLKTRSNLYGSSEHCIVFLFFFLSSWKPRDVVLKNTIRTRRLLVWLVYTM